MQHNFVPGLIPVRILPSGYNQATTTRQLAEEDYVDRVVLKATSALGKGRGSTKKN
jgi:hypothetical protein